MSHPPRVVLVRPAFGGNIGAAARVMANFALSDLVLVAPRVALSDRTARAMSTKGEPILDAARVVESPAEAVADCVFVAGTTARAEGLYRGQASTEPGAVLAELIARGAHGPTALMFGPEDHGLTNDEIALCTRFLTLPAHEDYPVLNLAQAVAIVCSDWFRASQAPPAIAPNPPANVAHTERMFTMLQDALTRVGFLFGPDPRHLMFALRNVVHRAGATSGETDILIGLARQIRWYVDHHPDRIDPPCD